MSGPLQGYRVLDLSRVLAGPWATQIFADFGAEVTKVERPGAGDDTRTWGPPWLRDRDGRETRDAAYYLCANRGKRSITADITLPEGRDRVLALAREADVLVENYKVGGLAKYGLDYASIAKLNPRIVYCSITGFGQDGPYAQRAGYDFLVQGMGGLMSLNGEPDGQPQKVGVALSDVMTGLYAAIAVQAALLERERSGLGQQIDLALLDVTVATLANQAMNYLVGGTVPQRLGNAHPNVVPYQTFAASDGHLILAIGNDSQFRRFCEAAGLAPMGTDPRYATNAARLANREALCADIEAIMQTRSMDDWISTLERAGVPCGPINTLDRVFRDPQVLARGMLREVEHPVAGPVTLVANPIRFSRSSSFAASAPPVLGEHDDPR